MMRAAGKRVSMQPFMTPTNGPWWPKSVVMVMTPEGLGAFMRQRGLHHLLGEVGRQRVRLVAQIGARIAGALAQLVAALEQSVAYRLGIHFAPPGTSGCPPAAASFLEPLLQPVERLDELPHPFALELRRDGLQIDIEPLQALARIAAFGNVALMPQLRSAQAPIGIQGLERHVL